MQKDMHFYGVYALARSAGIKASWKYRNYVLYDLLPGIGLIV